MLEEVREHRVRVQRNMAKYVVEDVGLRQVVELLPFSDGDRRRKFSQREALKKALRRDVSRDWNGFPAGGGSEAPVYFSEIGYGFPLQANSIRALQEDAASVFPQLLHPSVVKQAPDSVVFRRIGIPILLDEDGRVLHQIVECGG